MGMFDFFGLKKKTGKTKILVVDDDPSIVRTLQDRLEMVGYDVCTSSNGKDGLLRCRIRHIKPYEQYIFKRRLCLYNPLRQRKRPVAMLLRVCPLGRRSNL